MQRILTEFRVVSAYLSCRQIACFRVEVNYFLLSISGVMTLYKVMNRLQKKMAKMYLDVFKYWYTPSKTNVIFMVVIRQPMKSL
ncbi:hypothetical protein TY87_07545 [Marinomonas sp. BSi20584]|nr:hypothetical protein TY87_07545 [Marinomonas sp. BSi20584]